MHCLTKMYDFFHMLRLSWVDQHKLEIQVNYTLNVCLDYFLVIIFLWKKKRLVHDFIYLLLELSSLGCYMCMVDFLNHPSPFLAIFMLVLKQMIEI